MDVQHPLARKKHGGKKYMLLNPRIDMTPMVDLGFLLITFFIFTTSMSQPTVMKLFMPSDKFDPTPTKVEDRFALTIILGAENRIYYYHGTFDDARIKNEIYQTTYDHKNGVGNIIRIKLKNVAQFMDGINKMVVLIKPTPKSTYQNTVDVLDEMLINNVRRYAIVDLEKEELVYLNR